MKDIEKFVLFGDNLSAQQTDEFKNYVSDGLKIATDLWQDVDVGITQTLNAPTGYYYQKWLDERDSLDLWHGHEKSLTAMQKQVLVTHWAGNAWATLCSLER